MITRIIHAGLLLALGAMSAPAQAAELEPGIVEPGPGQTIAEAIAAEKARRQEQERRQRAVVQESQPEAPFTPNPLIRSVREAQKELARDLPADVELETYDTAHFSATRIRGKLPEFEGLIVHDVGDIEALLPTLARYLGFIGEEEFIHARTEDLGARVQYLFFETIAGFLLRIGYRVGCEAYGCASRWVRPERQHRPARISTSG